MAVDANKLRAVRIYPTSAGAIQGAAERITLASEQAFSTRGRFTLALSGGRTPHALYDLLASPEFARRIDWATTYIFWSDERCVPPESRDSNYHLAIETLLNRVSLPHGNIFRIRGELPPAEAADHYEQVLRDFFLTRLKLTEPRFDVMLLGMGADGHTASLFPGAPALREQNRWVVPSRASSAPIDRVSFTFPALNAAAHTLFLVSGEEKAGAVARALDENTDVNTTPAAGVQLRRGELRWLIDVPAASQLPREDDTTQKLRETIEMIIARPGSRPDNG